MVKMVLIGAGSTMFAKDIVGDLLGKPDILVDEMALVDIDKVKLDLSKRLYEKMIAQSGKKIKVIATTDRRSVLPGAKYVINCIAIGGPQAAHNDVLIPDKYGVNQNLGDSLGPGGAFRTLRVAPEIIRIGKDIEELCPNALFFQHSNPMCAINIPLDWSTNIKHYGICHSVQGTVEHFSNYLGVPVEKIDYWCAGINHMAWFLNIEVDGVDQYPKLFEIAKDKERIKKFAEIERGYKAMGAYLVDWIRFEALEKFRYFVTESPFHFGEYTPYFRKNEQMIREYFVEDRWWLRHEDNAPKYYEEAKRMTESDEPVPHTKSHHYVPDLIESVETNRIFYSNLNVPNNGLILNLPSDCNVEVPCYSDHLGIHPCAVGKLPEQLAGLNRTNINFQLCLAHAITEKKLDYIYDAIRLDPLTSALLTLGQIDKMVDEMIEANKKYLMDYK
ncbi:MAG: alpha-glucosidase/alpha-galactosidase [Eubacteriales bacterium]|nr:alpha-glucosidase/alpha-galactosidase [Eubacteriales bacterium]